MIFQPFIPFLTTLFVSHFCLITITTALPNGFFMQSAGGERALGYNNRPTGPTTPKPTWRPKNKKEIELTANDLAADAHFPDDYYDDYDGESEGTRRNIDLHHTFEARMKQYEKLMQQQILANKKIKAVLAAQKAAAVAAKKAAAAAAAAAKKKSVAQPKPRNEPAEGLNLGLGLFGLR